MHFFADCVYPKSIPSHRFTPSRPRVPHPSRVFCERVGIGDSTARVIATLRDHHDRGCPTLLASFARGWGLGIPPPELSQRCGTITTKGAPSFSRLLREGGDWGFHRTTYSDAAEPSRPRVPHPSRVFARGWGLGIPPPELSRRCGTITTKSVPPFSRLLREGGDWGFHRATYSDAAEPSQPRVPHPSRVFCERVGIADSTARLTATLRNHHNRGCPTLLASFARGWGLGIPPHDLQRRCGTITIEGAPPFSRLLREGGDWGFHRPSYRNAAEPSQPRVPHPSRVFARGWGLGIPPHDLQRRCGTITTEGAPPFSRVCERVGIR